jgi:two-component system chemotaxis response regulator CheY
MTTGSELEKPSLFATDTHFANVSIALAHADPKAAVVVKSVLDSLGCKAILLARDGQELIQRMTRTAVDLAVFDSTLRGMSGTDAVKQLRQSTPSVRELPIILLDGDGDTGAIGRARDAGVNEYIRKPFSAKTLLSGVHTIVENSRPFIVSSTYIGPDRRANPAFSSATTTSFAGDCRRLRSPRPIGRGESDILGNMSIATVLAPDGALRRKMGLAIREVLSIDEAKINVLEQTLVSARETYSKSVQQQVRELISFNRLLFTKPDQAEETATAIRSLAGAIERNAIDLGLSRVSEVAGLLHDFCRHYFVPGNNRSLILLEKHALALMGMLRAGNKEASAESGDAIVKELLRQVASVRDE